MKPFLKQCSKCRKQKWNSEFYKDKNHSDKTQSHCKECQEKRQNHPNYKKNITRKALLKHSYNLTLRDYELMLKSQNRVCKICEQPETKKNKNGNIQSLSVDHCHLTDKIRGLLCSQCNPMLGVLENKEWCEKAADYLKKHK